MKKITLLVCCFLLGCGTEVKKLGDRTLTPPSPPDCRGAGHPTFHEVTVKFPSALPARIGLEMDGALKVSECVVLPETEPKTLMDRDSADQLHFTVMHGDYFPALPTSVSFRILDLGDCSAPPTVLLDKLNLPLRFQANRPRGPRCGTNTFARETVIVPGSTGQ